ncbi:MULTISPECIES: RlmE family RNA methyltransferase [Desulfococcus]|jgi:23S rRNA (uridine2552-2'-O)-methyltransferase|uniref:Ribosomal RNA large subunit methyltransferase E n=1 Tax=Desulfococcus multivorans DSM 2059 TaxID=1121405 RepID=S7U2Z2_DESML|nr:RlmE family RNA methyltransferase [Desulfococcus multivorans]AOY58563.1 RlmE: ribosomal RNA large subunit methyltransferase E (23S rRNA methyltransferase) [Desulfococcus multivorans]AQV00869.1 50S rRNA methyltransferase [Desulfococcus multivorans]EPR43345.1 Ribosomal RNA large subunit methyltransferase E [Desulfococcus multivorans DSM 2059]MDX9820026.1 RlmE family RNA methyltransferase [Desulfococcus multivorans]SJZ43361.1 23S rRNA Um-2552 2'-O-methyltransferase [Desulfococcus multivorans D
MKRRVSTSDKNRWADHYTQKARKENYPARSVYKLQEIQQKTRLIRKGNRVLDLGCAPGSWLIYAARLIGESGQAVGIDLKPVTTKLPSNASAHIGDLMNLSETLHDMPGAPFDVVLSDMAPDTTGNKTLDAIRSAGLAESALSIACKHLVKGGMFACKIFQGSDFDPFVENVRREFDTVRIFKPKSSRKASKEIFVIGLGKT